MKISPIWLLVLCALQPQVSAQDLEIVTVDGQRVSGVVTGLSSGSQGPELELRGGRRVLLSEVLELHGFAPRPVSGAIVRLVGGDELRGVIRAGDDAGETFVVDSPVFGQIAIELGFLSRSEVGELLAQQREKLLPLSQLLVDDNLVSREIVEQELRRFREEHLYRAEATPLIDSA